MNDYMKMMIELDADGIDFIPISLDVYHANGIDFMPISLYANRANVIASYTRKEFESVDIIPKTGYRYWKVEKGKKRYLE